MKVNFKHNESISTYGPELQHTLEGRYWKIIDRSGEDVYLVTVYKEKTGSYKFKGLESKNSFMGNDLDFLINDRTDKYEATQLSFEEFNHFLKFEGFLNFPELYPIKFSELNNFREVALKLITGFDLICETELINSDFLYYYKGHDKVIKSIEINKLDYIKWIKI